MQNTRFAISACRFRLSHFVFLYILLHVSVCKNTGTAILVTLPSVADAWLQWQLIFRAASSRLWGLCVTWLSVLTSSTPKIELTPYLKHLQACLKPKLLSIFQLTGLLLHFQMWWIQSTNMQQEMEGLMPEAYAMCKHSSTHGMLKPCICFLHEGPPLLATH